MLGDKAEYAYLNPFTFIVEIVRDPIIGIVPDIKVYFLNFCFLIILYLVLHFVMKYKGDRIIYWI